MKIWKCPLCNFVIKANRITKVAKILHFEDDVSEGQNMSEQGIEWQAAAYKELEKLK